MYITATNLVEDHGRNLLWREGLCLSQILNLYHRISALINDLEWPGLNILLDSVIIETATNETPRDVGQ
jgi:hypothetical protein